MQVSGLNSIYFSLWFLCISTSDWNRNHKLSVCHSSHRVFRKFLSLQGDTPTFRFKVSYHFWQGLIAYWLVTSIIDWQMATEASAQQAVIMTGYGPHPLHLMRKDDLLNVQNKILVSKNSIFCLYNTYLCLSYIKWKFHTTSSHFYGFSIQWHLVAWLLLCISQSL